MPQQQACSSEVEQAKTSGADIHAPITEAVRFLEQESEHTYLEDEITLLGDITRANRLFNGHYDLHGGNTVQSNVADVIGESSIAYICDLNI